MHFAANTVFISFFEIFGVRIVRKRTWSIYSWILMTFAFGFLGLIMLFGTNNMAENIFKINP